MDFSLSLTFEFAIGVCASTQDFVTDQHFNDPGTVLPSKQRAVKNLHERRGESHRHRPSIFTRQLAHLNHRACGVSMSAGRPLGGVSLDGN